MRCSAMLHPTQPARRAVAASGVRFTMADAGNAKLGISNRFFTRHESRSYCMKKKFGVASVRIASIIAR